MSITKTITDLVDYLNTCRDAYYNYNRSIISDEQYDKLFDELKKLEEETGIVLTNSPTQTVGYTVKSELEEVEHKYPLLSLDKTQSYSDMLKFCSGHKMLFMYKVDGLTCQLTYKDGKLFRAETRGDGFVGEDITHNARTFIGVPATIPYKGEIRITGEAVINRKDFLYINETLGDIYKNPRNLASGSVRQLDSTICDKRKVRFIVWNANDLSENDSMYNGLMNADKIGFTIVHFAVMNNIANEEQIETTFNNIRNHTQTDYIPIDGIVAMYDSMSYGASLGKTAHHFNNGLAFKFYNESYETTLNKVEFTIGKTGVLTPTAVFDPVDIDGTTVTKASVHNISILGQLNLCVDDCIEVYKANEIIPQIRVNNTKHNSPSEYLKLVPNKCPYCGSDTAIKKSDDSDTRNLFCTNKQCKGVLLKKLSAFVSRNAMNIDGLSEKTLEKFIDLGFIKCYSDIFNLYNYQREMIQLDGFGEKSVKSLLESIEKAKNTTLDRLILAMNIDGIGKQSAKDIANFVHNDEHKLCAELRDLNSFRFKLLSIDGFGDIVVNSIVSWFKNDDNAHEFYAVLEWLHLNNSAVNQTGNALTGKNFVITGKLIQFANRNELVSLIERNGGKVQSAVNKETTYLINNDINSTSGKNKKAKDLNIPIISENDFMQMLV